MPSPIRPGDVLGGKYRVERLLGRGGMSVVLAARDFVRQELVAIKFPLLSSYATDGAERLLREGRAMMRLSSEHIARIYDVGIHDTGEPYLVMEYLVGTDLRTIVDERGPLRIEVAVNYAIQATKALGEAHARRIVHRDIKPANLFLARRADDSTLIKVIDFGVAKTPAAASDASLTISSTTVGTPLFMAPEQMSSSREIDARTDIWSLGATLFTLVTGAPPFPRGSIVEIHDHIRRGAPHLRTLRPDAPQALEALILRCMQFSPEDRFPHVGELMRALLELQDSRMATSRPTSWVPLPPAERFPSTIPPASTEQFVWNGRPIAVAPKAASVVPPSRALRGADEEPVSIGRGSSIPPSFGGRTIPMVGDSEREAELLRAEKARADRAIRFEAVHSCLILALGRGEPTDLDWDAYLAELKSYADRRGRLRLLWLSLGGAPTLAQKGRMVALLERGTTGPHAVLNPVARSAPPERIDVLRIAVVTSSTFARGVFMALGFARKHWQLFHPGEIQEALQFLELPVRDYESVEERIFDLGLPTGAATPAANVAVGRLKLERG